MDIGLALLCGVLYFMGTNRMGYTMTAPLGSPIFIGFCVGLYLGDVPTGLMIGASIQLVYLGIIMTGGRRRRKNPSAGKGRFRRCGRSVYDASHK